MDQLTSLIELKSPGAVPLFLVRRGSHAYGTNIETSDVDYAGVFCQSENDILGMSYVEQINDDNNDIVIYEIRRFLELLMKNNPTVLELLNTPKDCIIYKHSAFDKILEKRDMFVTKGCMYSFGGYARDQISKARGQDKKQNWEKNRIVRKQPIDFCYLLVDELRHRIIGVKTMPLVEFFDMSKMDNRYCGLSKVPHGRDIYALYYDWEAEDGDSESLHGFRGISFENSNDIRLSSIPEGLHSMFVGYISYNKDGYTKHCQDYKSYQTWISERNEQRWIDVKSHNQKIDGKNMMHCVRLITMAKEIASGMGVLVRRPDFEYLIKIRRGQIDLKTLIDQAELDIKECDVLFKSSTLPEKIDIYEVNNMLINIRKIIYG